MGNVWDRQGCEYLFFQGEGALHSNLFNRAQKPPLSKNLFLNLKTFMEKITLQVICFEDSEDYRTYQALLLNGKSVWHAADLSEDCPEDATLSRDMTNVFEIIELMEKVAGKEIEFLPIIECEDFDEYEKLAYSK